MNLKQEIDKACAEVREAERRKTEVASRIQVLTTQRVEAEIGSLKFAGQKELDGAIIESRSVDAVLKAKRDRVTELEKLSADAELDAERASQIELCRELADISEKACEHLGAIAPLAQRFARLADDEGALVLKANIRREKNGERPMVYCARNYPAFPFPVADFFYRDAVKKSIETAGLERAKLLKMATAGVNVQV